MFCKQCANEIPDAAAICVRCGVATGSQPLPGSLPKSRTTYILLGLFLGGLGIHNFYAGYTGRAIAQLLITLFTGWLIFPWVAVAIWALIEVIFITKDARGAQLS